MAELNNNSLSLNKKQKGSHRKSLSVDLTPMVDLGFLLISFFVFTTTMSEAKAMDILEPKEGLQTEVRASDALTIIVGANSRIDYYPGEFNPASIKQTGMKELRKVITDHKKKTDPHFMMIIIKTLDNASFGDCINVMDEMAICDIMPGHYAEAELMKEEKRYFK